jgi:ATP-dependent protease HslVU (ClpYQ) peptidase subunit
MTCIVGLVDGERVVLGADSFGSTDGCYASALNTPKLITVGQLLVGYTSAYRFGQLLQYAEAVPPLVDQDPDYFLVSAFVPWLRRLLSEAGWQRVECGREEGGQALIACRGRLFVMQDDYSILEPACGYEAIGCGREYGRGSLHTSACEIPKLGAEDRIRMALRAAAAFDPHVGQPFVVRSL